MADVVHVDELEFKGHLFRASDFLAGPNVSGNKLDPSYEDFLKHKGVIPVSALVHIPTHPSVTVDWTCDGWFSIFEIAFRTGFSLPCSKLMSDVIKALGVMPFQLMPYVWKLVYAVESVCKKHQLEITVQDLMNCYVVRTVGKGRVSFRAIKGDEALITNLDTGDDKNWSCRFMFINLASLGEGYEYIPDRLATSTSEWVSEIDDESLARLTAFRNVGSNERAWPRALCRSLIPQFDPVKVKTRIVVSAVKDVEMTDFEKIESSGKDNGSASVVAHEGISSVGAKSVSTRTRGKGKLISVNEELQALRKRAKVEGKGSKDAPIEIPAAIDRDEAMIETPLSSVIPVSVPAATVAPEPAITPPASPATHSPGVIHLRKVMKALSLRKAEFDFCEASSPDRSDEISGSMGDLDEEGILNAEYNVLEQKSVYASFQALHFVSAAARARKSIKSEEANLKAALSESSKALEQELLVHTETVLELSRTKNELQMAKEALEIMDKKMTRLLDEKAILEHESKDAALQYTMMARISMLLESDDVKATWNVKEEIAAFKLKFPDSSLEEWGVSEVEDNPAQAKEC